MTTGDALPLEQFFSQVAAEDRYYLKEDVTSQFVGFVQVGVLRGHVKDPDGHPRDLVLMEMPLGKWFEWWY